MALDVKVGTFTSVAGPQTISVGFQPKVVIIFGEYRGSSGRRSESIGASDGTNNSARGISTNDAAWGRVGRLTSDSCVLMERQGTGIVLKAAITAFTSTGFTIDFTTHSQSETFTYLALGGTDIANVAVGSFVFPTGNTHTLNLGFQPDALLLASLNTGSLDTGYSKVRSSMGFFDGTASYSIGQSERSDGTHDRGGWKTGVVSVLPGDATTGTTAASVYELTATFQSGGIDFTKTVGGTTQGAHFYVAIAGPQVKVGNQAFPTATGAQSITGVGFQPAVMLFQADGRDLNGAVYGRPDWGFFGASDVTTDSAVAIVNKPTSYSEDTRYSATYSVLHEDYTSGTLSAADVSSFDADGYTLNWAVVDATQRMLGWMAIGPAAGGGSGGGGLALVSVVSEQTNAQEGLAQRAALFRLLGEAVDSAESTDMLRALVRPFSEALDTPEALATVRTLVRMLGETGSLLEQSAMRRVLIRLFGESFNIIEQGLPNVRIIRTLVEASQLSEGALHKLVASANLIIQVAETLNSPEALYKAFALVRPVIEVLDTPEDLTTAAVIIRPLAEALSANEVVAPSARLFRLIAETLDGAEALSVTRRILFSIIEQLQNPETSGQAMQLLRPLVEQLQTMESTDLRRVAVMVIGEILQQAEAFDRTVALARAVSEQVSMPETQALIKGLAIVISETMQIPEAVAYRVALQLYDALRAMVKVTAALSAKVRSTPALHGRLKQ